MAGQYTTTTIFSVDISELKKAMVDARKEIKLSQSEFKLATAGMTSWKDSAQGVSAQLKFLNSTISSQEKYVSALREQYEKIVASEGETSSAAVKLKTQLNYQEAALAKNKSRLQELSDTYGSTTDEIEDYFNETKKSADATEEASEAAEKLQSGYTVLKNVIANLVTDGIRKLVSGLKDVVSETINYESAFADVKKTVDGTDEQLAKLDQSIRDMSTRMPQSASEIAEVAAAAGQLGIATDDIADFAEVMVMLGDSTNLSSTEAASALAKFANITKMSANDYSNLGSVIVALGNNFATTEADIVSMATNLASTGELTGLSEANIMAVATALSSVGIEAQAGGTAFSKLLKQMQTAVETGSPKLEKFAEVAGMTSEQFKTAFGENAVGALSQFIGGLNDTDRLGQSAIVTLEDMGLTEVRLSNAILSLANNSDLLENAVSLSNSAWKENNALVNEASQRYETTESKLAILKNRIQASLQPVIEDLIKSIDFDAVSDTISEVAKAFANFAKFIVNNASVIISAVKAIIAGFAAFKIAQGISAAARAFDGLTASVKAGQGIVGLLKNAGGSIGLIAAGATVAVVGLIELFKHLDSVSAETQKMLDAMDSLIAKNNAVTDSWKSTNDSLKENNSQISAQYDRYDSLKAKLIEITDENGNVKAGMQEQAQVILDELNPALGTEYEIVDGQIQKYGELVETLDSVIQRKKLEAIVNAYGEQIVSMEQQKSDAIKSLAESEAELAEITPKINELESQRVSLNKELTAQQEKYGAVNEATARALSNVNKELSPLKAKQDELKQSMNGAETALTEASSALDNYNTALVALQGGSAEAVTVATEKLQNGFITATNATHDALLKQQNDYKTQYDYILANQSKFSAAQIQQAKTMYAQAQRELQKFDAQQRTEIANQNAQRKALYAQGGKQDAQVYTDGLSAVKSGISAIGQWLSGSGKAIISAGTSEAMSGGTTVIQNITTQNADTVAKHYQQMRTAVSVMGTL